MQQGGDMVRIGGLQFAIDPTNIGKGHRIQDMELKDKRIEANKSYKVARWASMERTDGPPIWDVVSGHLRDLKHVKVDTLNAPGSSTSRATRVLRRS